MGKQEYFYYSYGSTRWCRPCGQFLSFGQYLSKPHTVTFWPCKSTSGNLSHRYTCIPMRWHLYKVSYGTRGCNSKRLGLTQESIKETRLNIYYDTFLQHNTLKWNKETFYALMWKNFLDILFVQEVTWNRNAS